MLNVKVVHWYDEEAPGEVEDGEGQVYQYLPATTGDLKPDEWSKALIGKVEPNRKNEGRPLRVYMCRSFVDGRVECDCPDYYFRRVKDGSRCRHLEILTDLGIIREPEPEPLEMTCPW